VHFAVCRAALADVLAAIKVMAIPEMNRDRSTIRQHQSTGGAQRTALRPPFEIVGFYRRIITALFSNPHLNYNQE